jgi:peptide/nickel transport system permease protein
MSGRAIPSGAVVVGRPLAERIAEERTARRWLRTLRRGRRATVGLVVVALVALLALFAPWLARHDPTFGDFGAVLAAPSGDDWVGTDGFGRDVFARVLYGYRVSVLVAVASVAAALAIGAPLGLLAGYFGSTVDNLIMRPLDLLMAFPPILLAITLVAIFNTGLRVTILALAVIYVPIMARILRSSVIATRGEEYVDAARAMGATPARLMLRHVLPNSLGPLVVQASVSMGIAILIEATLSFIGLGTQPPDPSLGSMLAEGRDFMRDASWVVLYPGLAIALAVLGFNLLGDGLRDAIDTRGR